MEKILDALVDEITTRVIAKLEANASGAYDFLKLKVKAENIEGLEEMIEEVAAESGAAAAERAVQNASFGINVNF